jgi:hypothetical protein
VFGFERRVTVREYCKPQLSICQFASSDFQLTNVHTEFDGREAMARDRDED